MIGFDVKRFWKLYYEYHGDPVAEREKDDHDIYKPLKRKEICPKKCGSLEPADSLKKFDS
jgi:hypothetical protein